MQLTNAKNLGATVKTGSANASINIIRLTGEDVNKKFSHWASAAESVKRMLAQENAQEGARRLTRNAQKYSYEYFSEKRCSVRCERKKEPAALLPKIADRSATPTGSKIRIANLLEAVNDLYPDILPEDVLKRFGHERHLDGKTGELVRILPGMYKRPKIRLWSDPGVDFH